MYMKNKVGFGVSMLSGSYPIRRTTAVTSSPDLTEFSVGDKVVFTSTLTPTTGSAFTAGTVYYVYSITSTHPSDYYVWLALSNTPNGTEHTFTYSGSTQTSTCKPIVDILKFEYNVKKGELDSFIAWVPIKDYSKIGRAHV